MQPVAADFNRKCKPKLVEIAFNMKYTHR